MTCPLGGGADTGEGGRDLSVLVYFWENRLLVLKDPGPSKVLLQEKMSCFIVERDGLLHCVLTKEIACPKGLWFTVLIEGACVL